jgi:hypothetical protein
MIARARRPAHADHEAWCPQMMTSNLEKTSVSGLVRRTAGADDPLAVPARLGANRAPGLPLRGPDEADGADPLGDRGRDPSALAGAGARARRSRLSRVWSR